MADYDSGDVVAARPSRFWWDEEDGGKCLAGTVQWLIDNDRARIDRYEKYNRLYGGSRLMGLRPWEGPGVADELALADQVNQDKLRFNVVKAAVDTVTSKVGKLRPRPTFLTDGGDWSLQLKAKKLQKFMDGAYHQADVYELGPDVFRDAMVFGTGVFHPHTRGKRLCSERVRPWELYVDPDDALYGAPRALYRVKWLAKQQAVAQFGAKARDAVVDAETLPRDEDRPHPGYIRVVEAWCLPTEPEPTPRARTSKFSPDAAAYGRHCVCVGDEVVLDEDWAWREFPFVFVHWTKPIQGFWGQPATQEVVGVQVEINKLLQLTQDAMRRVGQPMIITLDSVILTPEELTNEVALQVKVSAEELAGRPLSEAISVQVFTPIHPSIIEHIWSLWAKAFEIVGSNQLAASATAPVGMESGRALETLAEEHSERFMTVSRHFEHALGELMARQFLRLAKQLDTELKDGFVIRSPGSKASLRIKWSEVEMDEDAWLIQVFPTSVLPTTPAARIKEVERLAAAGWIDPTEARRLLDFPDLRQGTDLAVADTENLLHQLERMLEHGDSIVPEPYQDLQKAARWATAAILRAQADGVPSANIDRVRDFVAACEALSLKAQATAAAKAAVEPQPVAEPAAAPLPPNQPEAAPAA